jgi:diaminohydroxyphosphoribosylaminopyrimidine deaminase/5-amino-6-(5-phosphoribosylamino)uracil reductase
VKIHEKYILRCIELGKNGLGSTAPNPMVGCVIVYNDAIVGEGFTSPYGGPHAEVNAIRAVADPSLLAKATLYVTLEPCSHYGKTPPCADLIIKNKIPKVVIGIADPHDKVKGQGIERLRNAGCEVITPVLEKAVREHHRRFLTFHEKKRPYIILKWAETTDGFIAPDPNKRMGQPEPFWITNRYSRQRVHQWRSEEHAILVGTGTVLEDNPRLTSRSWKGKSPIRIVLDRELRIPEDFNIFSEEAQTLVLTSKDHTSKERPGVSYQQADLTKDPVMAICDALYKNNIQSVLIEGGATILKAFIDADIWDEARIFIGPSSFGSGLKAPILKGTEKCRREIGKDLLKILRND